MWTNCGAQNLANHKIDCWYPGFRIENPVATALKQLGFVPNGDRNLPELNRAMTLVTGPESCLPAEQKIAFTAWSFKCQT